jgi:hypothetical protein
MTLEAALIYEPARGWYLAPSPELEQRLHHQAPPRSLRKPRDQENHMSTLTVEDRALRMLAAGDSPGDINVATGLTKDEVEKLRRDFPGTTTHQTQPTRMPVRIDTGISNGVATTVTVTAGGNGQAPPLTIARLLEEASVHSNTSVRRAGKTIETKLDALRQQLRDLAANEAAKQQQAAAKAAAQREVARLEAELAAAKAKLRGTPAPTTGKKERGSGWTRAAASERMRARNLAKAAVSG